MKTGKIAKIHVKNDGLYWSSSLEQCRLEGATAGGEKRMAT